MPPPRPTPGHSTERLAEPIDEGAFAKTRERAQFVTDTLIDTTVAGYTIEGVLGRGASGIVYRAQHETDGRRAAFKVIKPEFASEPEYIQRMIEEARALTAIRHRGIVGILDFGTLDNGQPYLVTELFEGLSLEEQLKFQGKLTLDETLGILDELLDALGAAHDGGVIHRDLKPSNLFVATSGNGTRKKLKVLDFGLARRGDGKRPNPTKPGTMLGTPDFMAPEQVEAREVGPYTDVYAVGGIAFLLLTNRLPFVMSTAFAVIAKKMAEPAPRMRVFNPKIPPEIDELVNGMLARDPRDRPTVRDARAVIAAAAVPRSYSGPVPRASASSVRPTEVVGDATVLMVSDRTAIDLRPPIEHSPLASPPQGPTSRGFPMLQDPNEALSTDHALEEMKIAGAPNWLLRAAIALGLGGAAAAAAWYALHP